MTSPAPYVPTPDERQELKDIQDYLRGHARDGTKPAEGSFTRVLRMASPNVKAHILANREFAQFIEDGGRSMPFADRISIDPKAIPKDDRALINQLKTEELTAGVLERMGTTPAQQAIHNEPPTMREQLASAFDHHEGANDGN